MIRIKITENGDLAGDLRDMSDRARNLGDVDAEVAAAIVEHNAGVNFDPDHPASILEVAAGDGSIGARGNRGSYADLLDIPDDEIGDILKRHIVGSQE